MPLKKNQNTSLALALLTIFAVLALYYLQNPFFEAFEAKTYDLRFKTLRGPLKPDKNIAIIAIDEKSIAEFGRYPWTRTTYVDLIDNVANSGGKALIMDAFFPEQESRKTDQAFADAMKRAGNVSLAVAFGFEEKTQKTTITRSINPLDHASNISGHMNFIPEEDGINRRNLLVISHEGKHYPSLGLRGAMAALNVKDIKFDAENHRIIIGDKFIPVGADNAMWINHTGPPGLYKRFSFVDVAKGRVPPGELRDKILFMGSTALGIYDMRVTPFDGNTPGVEVHATVADNIINGNFIRQGGNEAALDMLFILVFGLLASFITIKLRLHTSLILIILLAAGYSGFAYFMFIAGHWISMIYPLTSIFLVYAISGCFKFIVLERKAKEMRSMFSSYVSSKLVDKLVADPEAARIGGDNKDITILFSDIKGFTTFSERNNPYKVVKTLNEYLAAMTQIIMKFDGTVDKFLGDGIMAYWGAPLAQPNHAELAMNCVIAMRKKMLQLKDLWEKEGSTPLSFRVGINSGEVIAGNIGAQGTKMEYTVIGDTVNLAARLESTAKYYKVDILVNESTYRLTKSKYIYRELDRIRVVGKSIPVAVYELLGANYDLEKQKLVDIANKFAEALTLYRGRKFDKALEIFTMFCKVNPDDSTSRLYVERCDSFIKTPPPPDWDGVFDRSEK